MYKRQIIIRIISLSVTVKSRYWMTIIRLAVKRATARFILKGWIWYEQRDNPYSDCIHGSRHCFCIILCACYPVFLFPVAAGNAGCACFSGLRNSGYCHGSQSQSATSGRQSDRRSGAGHHRYQYFGTSASLPFTFVQMCIRDMKYTDPFTIKKSQSSQRSYQRRWS